MRHGPHSRRRGKVLRAPRRQQLIELTERVACGRLPLDWREQEVGLRLPGKVPGKSKEAPSAAQACEVTRPMPLKSDARPDSSVAEHMAATARVNASSVSSHSFKRHAPACPRTRRVREGLRSCSISSQDPIRLRGQGDEPRPCSLGLARLQGVASSLESKPGVSRSKPPLLRISETTGRCLRPHLPLMD